MKTRTVIELRRRREARHRYALFSDKLRTNAQFSSLALTITDVARFAVGHPRGLHTCALELELWVGDAQSASSRTQVLNLGDLAGN